MNITVHQMWDLLYPAVAFYSYAVNLDSSDLEGMCPTLFHGMQSPSVYPGILVNTQHGRLVCGKAMQLSEPEKIYNAAFIPWKTLD